MEGLIAAGPSHIPVVVSLSCEACETVSGSWVDLEAVSKVDLEWTVLASLTVEEGTVEASTTVEVSTTVDEGAVAVLTTVEASSRTVD